MTLVAKPEQQSSIEDQRHRDSLPAHSLRHVVDGVHSIDFSTDKRVGFLLTPKMKAVETTSFLDNF
jgi:hypothetical protein